MDPLSDAEALLAKHADPLTAARAHADELEHQRSQEFRQRMADRRSGKKTRPPKLAPLPKPEDAGETILVIGDAHAHPKFHNRRFGWLGRAITDIQPDVVVDIGDFWDMDSLNAFDRPGNKEYSGKKYWLDIEAGIDAQERIEAQLSDWNRGRKQRLSPRFVRCLGNHEARIGRIIEENPRTLEGVFGYHDLMSAEFGWEEHPYLEVVEIGGVAFSHSFPSGVMGRPIGGENPAAMLVKKQHMSCIAGHSHLLDYCERNDAVGNRIQAAFAGCYFDYDLTWSTVNEMYARGLLVLRNVRNGSFDFEWIGMETVRRRYS